MPDLWESSHGGEKIPFFFTSFLLYLITLDVIFSNIIHNLFLLSQQKIQKIVLCFNFLLYNLTSYTSC